MKVTVNSFFEDIGPAIHFCEKAHQMPIFSGCKPLSMQVWGFSMEHTTVPASLHIHLVGSSLKKKL